MHEILVILKKDVRRLWWQIAAMLAICVPTGLMPHPAILTPTAAVSLEVLPLIWVCLIAQAIHQEGLVGDREFWMTRPYRWPRLLAAKALFAALFVHVPAFLIGVYILAAHGFNPFAALPHLLGQQLMLAAGLTLPAMALAAVLSNLTQFVIALPILLLTVSVWVIPQPRIPVGQIGQAVLAVAAVSVVLLQYGRRRTALARFVLVSGGLAAGVLTALAVVGPLLSRFAPGTATVPAQVGAAPTVGPAPGSRIRMACYGETGPPRVYVDIPVVTSGFPKAAHLGFAGLSVEVTGPNGVRFGNQPHARVAPGTIVEHKLVGDTQYTRSVSKIENQVFAGWSLGPDGTLKALSLSISRDAYDRLANGKITLAGRLDFRIYQAPPVRLRVGENREVPGVGRCFIQGPKTPHDYQLTVNCESASGGAMQARVALESPAQSGPTAQERVMASTQEQVIEGEYPGPGQTLLSPLRRGVVHFAIDPWRTQPVDQAVVLVQQLSAQGTAEVLLDGIELPDASRCHGR